MIIMMIIIMIIMMMMTIIIIIIINNNNNNNNNNNKAHCSTRCVQLHIHPQANMEVSLHVQFIAHAKS